MNEHHRILEDMVKREQELVEKYHALVELAREERVQYHLTHTSPDKPVSPRPGDQAILIQNKAEAAWREIKNLRKNIEARMEAAIRTEPVDDAAAREELRIQELVRWETESRRGEGNIVPDGSSWFSGSSFSRGFNTSTLSGNTLGVGETKAPLESERNTTFQESNSAD